MKWIIGGLLRRFTQCVGDVLVSLPASLPAMAQPWRAVAQKPRVRAAYTKAPR
ncbi:hypothetical protein AB6D20_027805 (plasmid) [Vibrio splendidus]